MRLSSRNRRKEIRAITIMRMHSTYEIFETKSKLATGSILIRPNIEIKLKRHWITLNSFLLGTFSFNCLTFIFIFFRLPLPFHLNYIIYNLFRKVRSLIFFPPWLKGIWIFGRVSRKWKKTQESWTVQSYFRWIGR